MLGTYLANQMCMIFDAGLWTKTQNHQDLVHHTCISTYLDQINITFHDQVVDLSLRYMGQSFGVPSSSSKGVILLSQVFMVVDDIGLTSY